MGVSHSGRVALGNAVGALVLPGAAWAHHSGSGEDGAWPQRPGSGEDGSWVLLVFLAFSLGVLVLWALMVLREIRQARAGRGGDSTLLGQGDLPMRVRDLRGWPPAPVGAYGLGDTFAIGEAGTLAGVERRQDQDAQEYLSLVVIYQGSQLLSRLSVDQALVEQLHALLTQHVGEPLTAIGGLNITS